MRWTPSTRPLSCREVVELVTDYLDDSLSPKQRARFEHHLTGCDPCVEYLGQIRATVALAHRVHPDPVDPPTTQRLVELYRAWQRPST